MDRLLHDPSQQFKSKRGRAEDEQKLMRLLPEVPVSAPGGHGVSGLVICPDELPFATG
jgi:hypothetical protein